MHHQKLPSYDGTQPFIYAAYCKEDENMVYPVLARMYNEGFRVCCAPSTGISSDYYTQQRMASAVGIIIFMSRIMAERLRLGDPEALAAARSPLLRTVVLLDDTDVSDSVFAMSVPDHQQYLPQNDSAFWLYIYSNDHFDACRGKWPRRQLLLRDAAYEDVNAEVVSEEYRRLESIMSVSDAERKPYDPFDPGDIYINNDGYIEPEEDEFTYEPLARVSAVRTEHDDQFDEVLGLINEAENAALQSSRRVMQATAAAAVAAEVAALSVSQQEAQFSEERANEKEPELISFFSPADDEKARRIAAARSKKRREMAAAIAAQRIQEMAQAKAAQEAQEAQAEAEKQDAEPKADLIVTPVEKQEAAEEKKPEPPAALQDLPKVSEEESAAAAETIIASAEVLLVEQPAQDKPEPEQNTPAAAEAVQEAPRAGRSSVPVMVRRQQHRRTVGKVERKRKRTVQLGRTPAKAHRSAMHLSSVPGAEGAVPHAISSSITFEQYVRDIARSCVSELLVAPPEEAAAPQPPARKHRQRAAAVVTAPPEIPARPEEPPAEPAPSGEEDAKPATARKNRHPHQKNGFFSSIVSALRNSRRQAEATDAEGAGSPPESPEGSGTDNPSPAERPPELRSVVEKFIESNEVPPVTVVPRTMVRRYRD